MSGYQMDSDAQAVTVADDGIPKDIVFYNTPENAILAITKVDANTNAPWQALSLVYTIVPRRWFPC